MHNAEEDVAMLSLNKVFLDFLAQLRDDYLSRDEVYTVQSVILAGVHDVKNIKYKIRPEEDHKVNSPWNTIINGVGFSYHLLFCPAKHIPLLGIISMNK